MIGLIMKIKKYVRRTPTELKSFRAAKTAFLHQGYPEDIAEQYAWDILFSARRAKNHNYFGGTI